MAFLQYVFNVVVASSSWSTLTVCTGPYYTRLIILFRHSSFVPWSLSLCLFTDALLSNKPVPQFIYQTRYSHKLLLIQIQNTNVDIFFPPSPLIKDSISLHIFDD